MNMLPFRMVRHGIGIPGSRPDAWSNWLAFIVFVAALFALPSLRAEDELEFAVPDEGRITLGVFDGSGKLVRVLHRLAKESDFQVGLNGLITSWDGKNDAGERVASGHYYVRGYLIGDDVRVSGEDFLFNDWAVDSGFPGFSSIKDFSLLENGDVILLAEAGSNGGDVLSSGAVPSGHLIARFSPDKGFLWSCKIEPTIGSVWNGAQGRTFWDAAHFGQGFSFFKTRGVADACPGLLDAAPLGLNPKTAFPVAEHGPCFLNEVFGLKLVDITSAPSPFPSMDADAATLIEASPDGIWIRQESFQPVKLPTSAKSVALGMPGTFWFVGEENGAPFVGQSTFAGEILRALRPAADDPKPEKIRASRMQEKFAVIESLPGLQRLRVMARAESGEWTIEWGRTLRESANFGFVDGKPAADAGGAPQEKNLRFRLKENPLTGKRDFLTVRAEFDASGSRLVSPDGLPLVEISSRNDIRRTAIRRGDKPESLRLLQGNGAFVEEFSIAGLDDILPLDAGGIDIP